MRLAAAVAGCLAISACAPKHEEVRALYVEHSNDLNGIVQLLVDCRPQERDQPAYAHIFADRPNEGVNCADGRTGPVAEAAARLRRTGLSSVGSLRRVTRVTSEPREVQRVILPLYSDNVPLGGGVRLVWHARPREALTARRSGSGRVATDEQAVDSAPHHWFRNVIR